MSMPPAGHDVSASVPALDPSREGSDALDLAAFEVGESFDIASASLPATPPDSGDFHAAIPLEDGTVALVMGDVVGHGPQAAAHAQTLCRAIGDCLIEGLPPGEALGFVNAAAEMSPEFEGFATAFAGTVDPGTGTLTYSNGGHEPGLVARPMANSGDPRGDGVGNVQELNTTGPPLGVLGADQVQYGEHTVDIKRGGALLLYTDGITEARRGQELLGTERLRALLARYQHLRPMRLVRKLLGYACAFVGRSGPLRDDAAVLVLRRRQAP